MSKPKPSIKSGEEAMKLLIRWAKSEESKRLIPIFRKVVMEKCNELQHCPFCSQPIKDTKTTFTQETAKDAIIRLLNWSKQTGRHEFKMSEVKDSLTKTQYANLNHLTKFGGIVYRPINPKTKKPYRGTYYGIHRGRADEFLSGARGVPMQVQHNRFSRERVGEAKGSVDDLPHVNDLLDADGEYKQPNLIKI